MLKFNSGLKQMNVTQFQIISYYTGFLFFRRTIEVMAFHPKVSVDLAKFLFQRLSKKPAAIPSLWNYTKNHWDALMSK